MILVIPVTKPECERTRLLGELLALYGPAPRHRLMVLAFENTMPAAEELCRAIQKLFNGHELVQMPDVMGTDVAKINRMFQTAAIKLMALAKAEPGEAFFWCEPNDVVPMHRDWLEKLDLEYRMGRKSSMGVLEQMYEGDKSGEGFVEAGVHLPRCSVYSIGLAQWSVLLNYLVRSFDVEMQWEITRNCHHTGLIQHNFGTMNYRMEDKKLICDSGFDMDYPVKYANPVRKDTVVVTGCVDDSLLGLVMERVVERKKKLAEVEEEE